MEPQMKTKRAVSWIVPGATTAIPVKKGAPVLWDKVTRQHLVEPSFFTDPQQNAYAIKHGCPIHYNNVDPDISYRMSDQPEECRFCGMRTAFEEVNKSTQFHTCQHCGAGYFVTHK